MTAPVLGIIGGSGLYDLPGLTDLRAEAVSSPFGVPSDAVMRGRLHGAELAFLPRHGRGHHLGPGQINYRANIDALKRVGVTDILSLSACGSLREALSPGTFVFVDQFIDRTRDRRATFFDGGVVAHVSMADPTCSRLAGLGAQEADGLAIPYQRGGTYLAMDGPQFSTRAEAGLYRQWNADVVGMTNMPEAKLAREAEICYLTVAMVTDYDCWRDGQAAVDVADVIRVLGENVDRARALVDAIARRWRELRPATCGKGCDRALDNAILTAPEARPPKAVKALSAVAGRVLGPARPVVDARP